MNHLIRKRIIFKHFFTIVVLFIFFSILSGCAPKTTTVYFPSEPASPRIQLLTSFNNEGSLRSNTVMDFIIGQDYSGSLSKAFDVAFHNGKLYIADSGKANPGIVVVDFTDKTLNRYTKGVTKPMSITIDKDGTLYVCDLAQGANPSIVVFDKNLNLLRRMTLDIDGYRPTSVLIKGDQLYVTDVRLNVIRVIDKQTGELIKTVAEEARLGWPVDLSETPEGNIVVTEAGAQIVRIFTPEGEQVLQIGSPGDRAGNFGRPKATDVDSDGNIYAVDVAFQNVQIFDSQGRVLMYFGHTGDTNSLFMPSGIAISYSNLEVFQQYAAPGFTIEYVIAVASQGGPGFTSKISIYGFGKLEGKDY